MDNGFAPVFNSAASVLVLLPQKPNFDTVAAGLSLYLSVMDQKSLAISCPSPMMVGFNRIIGVNKISSDLGNKNLTIKFAGYDAANIEKVSYDIINGEFNLTVIPKIGFTSPQKEQLNVSYAGISADLVILVGGANDSDFPALESEALGSAKVMHIGNRGLATSREVLSFAKPGSTISELVAGLIKDNGFAMDPDIATNLAMGIEDASSNFAGSEVTPETFEVFAYLLRSGGRRSPAIKLSPVNFPPGAIPTTPFNQPKAATKTQAVTQAVPPSATQPTADIEGTQETEQEINPPDDWLQPKVFKGSASPMGQSDSFSENKG